MFRDYSRSLEIKKVSAEDFHKEKGQSKKEKATKYSLRTAASSPQTIRGEKPLPDCSFFFSWKGAANVRSLLPQTLRLLSAGIFSK